jgi:uncharacterized protein
VQKRMKIRAGSVVLEAQLNETRTAAAVFEALPITGRANTWGDEIYFSIPLHLEIENGKNLVQAGDVGYWPEGDSLCLFFGPTPISRGDEIRPASPVTILGTLIGDPKILRNVPSGSEIIIERSERY